LPAIWGRPWSQRTSRCDALSPDTAVPADVFLVCEN
jgi:hypothetical protein